MTSTIIFFLIKLNVESLKNETNEEEIKSTQSSLKYLQDITNDILAASKDEVEKPIGLINIRELFESLCESLNSTATKKNIQLRCRASDIYLEGSSVILKRILENLIRNALQHTQHGGVLLAIRNLSTHYKIQVIDTGSGIAKEKLDNIQNAFTQGDTTNSGHGMGLYIVSNLCQQAGYELNISSRVGKGSVFTIKIKK